MSIDIIIDIELYIIFVTYINMGYWTIWDNIWHSKSYEFSVLKFTCSTGQCLILWRSLWKNIILTILLRVVFEIFMKNPMSHMIDFWIKPIWREVNCDVTGSTLLYEKQENRMKTVRGFFSVVLFPYQL